MSTKLRSVGMILAIAITHVCAYQEQLKETIKQCQDGREVTDDEVEEFTKPLVPKNQEERCLVACVFKEYKVIIDGHFDPVNALNVAKMVYKDYPEKWKRIKDVIDHCGEDIPTHNDNECDLAGDIMNCEVKYLNSMPKGVSLELLAGSIAATAEP
uniref:Odorant-binding protein 24 n=1 Tax=Apolygus lucorum TaxID=248454 RepID=A0A142FH91_APOLU|nr:odorant-binding protein 24 [Apolygus lucorum]